MAGARDVPTKFRVAFSLAGEEREIVRMIAAEVEERLGRSTVFLDEWYEHYIAGPDADILLQSIYGDRCDLAVSCISSAYGVKAWTHAEHRAIRERRMREADSELGRLGVLEVRVGDGAVRGVGFSSIVPDVQDRSVTETADLIIARLDLISKEPLVATTGAGHADWPETEPKLSWPVADHTEARAAFAALLTRSSSYRCLLVRGSSETGKSHMSKQMVLNSARLENAVNGRLDLKGTTGIDVEFESFMRSLGVARSSSGAPTARLGSALDELQRKQQPALLIFDTYEAAGELHQWIETVLLQELRRSPWLRIVVLGQSVPGRSDTVWDDWCAPTVHLKPPGPEEWMTYALEQRPDEPVDRSFVTEVHERARGRASVMASLLGPETG